MIDIIFFKSIGIFAKVWSPVSETLHTYKHVYDLHCWQVTIDWYGNKLVARNFLRTCWGRGGEGGGGEKRGIGVPRRMFGEIFYAFYGIIAYLRVEMRERATVVEKATGIFESSVVYISICTYLAVVKRHVTF